jgi:hypothetical protein
MGGELDPYSEKTWSLKLMFVAFLKQMLLSQRLLRTWESSVKAFTKQYHILIVGWSGNSLVRNYYYSTEKDLNFIAKRTTNTNVMFVNLLRRHHKLWMNERVSSMNLQFDWALMGRDMSHISVTDSLYCKGRVHNTWPIP